MEALMTAFLKSRPASRHSCQHARNPVIAVVKNPILGAFALAFVLC